MAGHSKWSNIKHKKNIQDKKKSKLFSKLINNIKCSLKNGKDSNYNKKLKNAITQALDNNISKNTINNIIEKTNDLKDQLESIYFKNNENIIFAIIIKNDSHLISEIKYIFNNAFFENIQKNKINDSIKEYDKIAIVNEYNETFIFNNIKSFEIKDFIDSNIIIEKAISDCIKNIQIFKQLKIKETLFVEFFKKNKINIQNKSKITALNKKLLQNNNIENVFTNIIL